MKTVLSLFFAAAFGLLTFNSVSAQSDFHEVLKKFNAAVDANDKLEYDFESKERRRKGNYISTEGHFRVQEGASKKVAAKIAKPKKATLIWKKGVNDNKVKVKLGPLNLNLKLTNKQLLADSHQTIDNAGFKLPQKTINYIYKTRKDEINEAVTYNGTVTYDGKTCYHYTISDKNHGTTQYTVKSGENLITIAHARAINQMQILELNPGVSNYFDVQAGDVITIPNSFGTKITIYLDKSSYLPLYMSIHDKKGLVGEYGHKNLDTNPTFTEASFTKDGLK